MRSARRACPIKQHNEYYYTQHWLVEVLKLVVSPTNHYFWISKIPVILLWYLQNWQNACTLNISVFGNWRFISEVFSPALFHHTTVCSMAWFYRKLIHSGMSNNLNAIIWYSETYTINLTCLKCLLRQQSSDPYMFLAIWCSPVPTKYCHYSSLTR